MNHQQTEKVKITEMNITPELAKEMLLHNTGNRSLREVHVAGLTRQMRAGLWQFNGDPIRRGAGGRIIDGQHRLSAVIRSGVTIRAIVVEGLPDNVFKSIDIGKKRSPGDTLGCQGEKNGSRLAAALALLDKYQTNRLEVTTRYTNTELESLLDTYPRMRECLLSSDKGLGLMPPAVMDVCYYLFSEKDLALADDFVQKAVRGIGVEKGHPWQILRKRLTENSVAKVKLDRTHLLCLCIRAWNLARSGKSAYLLRSTVINTLGATTYPTVK